MYHSKVNWLVPQWWRRTHSGLWPGRCDGDYADQMRLGPRFRLHVNEKSSSGGEGDGKWARVRMGTWAGAHWIGPLLHGALWWHRVHSRHPRLTSPQGSRRMAPPQFSPSPLWSLSLVIYRIGKPSTSFTPKYGIRLQSARDYIASLEDPTGKSDTETGFCADTRETNDTWVFAGLLKHNESRAKSINMV